MNRGFFGFALLVLGVVAQGACTGNAGNGNGNPGGGGSGSPGGGGSSGNISGGGGSDLPPPMPPREGVTISDAHPRIFFSTGNKERLLAKLTAGEAPAMRFKTMVDAELAGTEHYAFEQWMAALLTVVTGEAKYCTHAVAKTDEWVRSEEALISQSQRAQVAADSYLEVGPFIGSLAMVYDWCYAGLTADQRTRWQTYANQSVWNVWNPTQARWGNTVYEWSGWSIDNPYNNYHYSFMQATMLVGLAMYREAAEAPGWIEKFREDKLEKLLAGYNANIVGGGSREGTGYGTSQRTLFEIYDFWEGSTKERVWDLTPSTRLSLAHFIHCTVPTMDRIAPIGDHARDSTAAFFDYHREQVLVLQKLLGPSDRLGDVAQTFLEGASVKQMEQFFQFVWDFLYSEPTHAKLPLDKLPNTYYGPGTGYTFMRSGWGTDATWGALIGGPYTESHAHHDQGSLLIYKNRWLAYDENIASTSGIEQGEELHNLVRLVSGGAVLRMRSERSPGQTVALSDDANFVYWSGKLDAVYALANVTRVEREVVFVKPLETFVVFDRINATGVESAIWQLNAPAAPVRSGSKWTVTSSGSTLDVFPLLPAGAAAAVVPWSGGFSGGARLDITGTGNTRFLTVLAPGGRVQSATTSTSGANTIATVTFAGGSTGTFTFSTDGTGGHVAVSGGVSFDADFATSVQAIPLLLP